MNLHNKNIATLRFVQLFGIIGGLAGMGHGIFEMMQGNKTTTDIGSRIGAFTIIPNYLLTGITTIAIGLLIISWIIFHIDKPKGTIWLLIFTISLFLVGGGFAPIVVLLLVNLVATQIRSRLIWWERLNTESTLDISAKAWKYLLTIGLILLLSGISVWVFLIPPGQIYEITFTQYLCWSILLLGLCFIIMSIFAGFSYDTKNKL